MSNATTGAAVNDALLREIEDLKARLAEAQDTLRAIREGEIDALVITDRGRERVYTLEGADRAYRTILETMSEGAATLARDGTILFTNRQMGRLLATPLEVVTGKALKSFLARGQRGKFAAFLAESAAAGRGSQRFELAGLDGRVVPALFSVSVLAEGDASVCLVATDLTEVEAAADALRRTQARLQQVAEATPMLAWAVDADGTITLVEGQALTVERYEAQEIIGRSAFELLSARPEIVACLRKALSGKVVEETIAAASGHTYDARFAPARDAEGRVTGATGVALDVTARVRAEKAREESEEQFHRIVESSNEGIWMMDGEARITFANRRMGEMLGWTPEEMFGRPVYDFMDRRWARVARGRIRSEAAGRGAPTQYDAKYVRRDGSDVWAIVTRTPIFDEEGRYSGSLAMVTDVTERRRLEMEVLEAGETERRRIGQDLHDTLGQSLAALTLLLKLLGDRLEASVPQEAAEARRIGGVAQDAARQARGIARRLWSAVPHKPTGLAEALASLAEETSETFEIQCTLRTEGAVDLSDYAAASQAYLIAREAVANAMKHGHASDVRISLLRRENGISLAVTDNGTGLAPGFERSTGLGLRSMRYRASVMGASFDIRPAPGGGTVVACSIPAPLTE